MEVELRHLRSFVAAAEERHFGRAAEQMHLTQPSLSRQIRALENELETELFDRTSRPVRLTAAGAAFLEEARLALDQARRLVDRGRRAGRGELGHLSVAAVDWAYTRIVPSIIRAFTARASDVSLELSTQDPPGQAEALRGQRLDIGFGGVLIETRGLRVEPLLEDPVMAITPADHPLADQSEVSLEDLASENFVSVARAASPALVDTERAMFAQRGLSHSSVLEAPDIHAQLGLVAAGVGVGVQLGSFRADASQRVAFVPLTGSTPTAKLVLLTRRDDDRDVVQAFRHTAREVASSLRGDTLT